MNHHIPGILQPGLARVASPGPAGYFRRLLNPVGVRPVANVVAQVTGTVSRIVKHPGDAVASGDALLILECMKMEMPVEATVSGTVREVRCREGQAVSEGDVLVVLE